MNASLTRLPWALALFTMLSACHVGRETESFQSGRPLADAAQTLGQKYGYAISYEDPRRDCACDLVDESGRSMKTGEHLAPYRRIVPRSWPLRVEHRPGAGAVELARDIVSAAQSAMPENQFRVLESGDRAYIVPVGARDVEGRFARSPAPLDARISLPAEPRASWQLLNAICAAVSKAAGVEVTSSAMLWGIENSDGPPRYTVGANDEVARDVLRRALDTIFREGDQQAIWLMYYDSPQGEYALNLAWVPKVANKKGG